MVARDGIGLSCNTRASPRQGSAPSFNGTEKNPSRNGAVAQRARAAKSLHSARHYRLRATFRNNIRTRALKLRGSQMKKLVIALLATVVAFSVAGCVGLGKGKARPAVVTKG